MSKLNRRLSPSEAQILGLTVRPTEPNDIARGKAGAHPRYTISENQWAAITQYRLDDAKLDAKKDTAADVNDLDNGTVTNQYDEDEEELPIAKLSAFDDELGKMMTIEEYCSFYNLDFENMRSYKFVMWPVPYYNIAFNGVTQELSDLLTEEFYTEIVQKHMKPVEAIVSIPEYAHEDSWDRATYTDTHIGMDPNAKGKALYPIDWSYDSIMKRMKFMAFKILEKQSGDTLYLEDLGDFVDGLNGETVRKGHSLPQLMSNQEAFACGTEFKVGLIDILAPYYNKIYCYNVTDDNHAGDFGWFVNKSAKDILDVKYAGKVVTKNLRKFMDYYTVDNRVFVLCHGKDGEALKFGFQPELKPQHVEKIDGFLKHEELYRYGGEIQFCKGDSHRLLFDMSTTDDFDYMNYAAFSPSSEWIQTNFKKGRSGFVLEHYKYGSDDIDRQIVWFDKKGLKKVI